MTVIRMPRGDDPDVRDALARERDQTAAARDRVASIRDDLAHAHDEEVVRRTGRHRRSLDERRAAAGQRASAAIDREHSRRDRQLAANDRARSAAARVAAGVDDLTGALRRGVGMTAIQRDIDRAHRTGEQLVVAFVDVDGLKQVNDSSGHAAGDRLLRRAVELIATHMRSYDVIVRVGGDEFVCSLSGIDADSVRERFELVAADLATGPDPGSISIGLGELRAGDSIDDVVQRADTALLAAKGAAHAGVARRSPR